MIDPNINASLHTLAATVDLAVTIVDISGRVLEWNPAAERMYAIERDAIIGRPITSFFSTASLMVWQVLETARTIESTYHEPRQGIHVLVTAMPVFRDNRLVGAIAIERDVTRMVELSADLTAAQHRVATLEKQVNIDPDSPAVDPFAEIRGRHTLIQRALSLARRVSSTEAIVLIQGESGVGKELFARGIHLASRRSTGPFIALNCGAIPATLFESELFGHAPGAFTGASPKGQPGKLELAEGGTLFLDEVGDLPFESQVKLLRFLEDRRFYRVGGTVAIGVNVRILAATNRSLEAMVRQGQFRDDLYWRLNVIALDLPPLRDRKEDMAELIQMYVHQFSVRHGRPVTGIDPAVTRALLRHSWPGNVRELRNVAERLVVLSDRGWIGPDLLPAALQTSDVPPAQPQVEAPLITSTAELLGGLQAAVDLAERERIQQAIAATGSATKAAQVLGVSRGTFYYKCKRLGIDKWGSGRPT